MRLNSLSSKLLLSVFFVILVLSVAGCNRKSEISFSNSEREELLSFVLDKYPSVEILDYTFSTKNHLVQAAFLCKDISSGAETILVYVTDITFGYMDVANGAFHYEYSNTNGIRIEETDSVSTIYFSFIDTESDKSVDYKISFWLDENGTINFRLQDNS